MTQLERRQPQTVRERLRVAIPLLGVWTTGVVVIATVATQPTTRAGELLMDPSFTVGAKWYTGLVSNLGILAWTIGVAAAFAGAWLCRLGDRARAGRFLLTGGLVGCILLSDDLFQFHAVLVPADLHIPKVLAELVIGACIASWALIHWPEVLRTHMHLLLAAGVGLGVSFAVDAIYNPFPGQGWNVIEDGAKFLGVLAWATYFVVTTRDISRSVFVDALLTWPDAAYDSVYGALEELDLADEEAPATS